ncbi:MAG: OB-fold nucleic acid binding domain-containing protein, partial [Gemmatimonadota bacterium]
GAGGRGVGGPVRARRSTDRADHAQAELALDDPYAGLRFAGTGECEHLMAEYRILSFAASQHHPFALVRDRLPAGTVSSERFPDLPRGTRVRVAGLVVARQRPSTAKGFIFILMEDEAGPINAIVRPLVYEACRAAIRLEPFLLIEGTLEKDGATCNVIAESVRGLRLEDRARSVAGRAYPDMGPRLAPIERPETPPFDASDPFRYLEALRHDPPPSMDWGRGGGCR